MRSGIRLFAFACLCLLILDAPLSAQSSIYGRLVGVVRDAQGGALPGVAVTLSGPAALGKPTTATDVDGSYLFRALSPGTYNMRFEMSDFATLIRKGVVIRTGTTITINATLELAGIEESVTVTGDSPTVDVKTTLVGGTFDEATLQDVPSSTDIWGVLAQSPGIRMRGYDVGGSHKATQTPYETFGLRSQSRLVTEGVDTTFLFGGSGFYQDYYAIEEFQVSASGADVEMTSPGASMVMTIKNGGNRLSGLFSIEYENENMVGDNADEELSDRGFTGNPNLLFWEGHAELGGPIAADKVWFFGAYNHFKLDQVRSGIDPEVATAVGIFDSFIGKITYQASDRDKIIGFAQFQRKQAPNQGLSLLTPAESVINQNSLGTAYKAEWQRVWSGRLFSNVQVKYFGLDIDHLPSTNPTTHPARVDTATGRVSGSGGKIAGNAVKPHVSAQIHYYLPSRSGSHDFKFGFEWLLNSFRLRGEHNAIIYRDNSQQGRPLNVDEIMLFNLPTDSDDRNAHLDFFVQDIWTVSNRVTLSLGARLTRQHAYYQASELKPALPELFATGTREGRSLVNWLNLAPRLGVVFDVTGEGKTALKAHYGRYYVNLDGEVSLSDANPNGIALQRNKFLDPNENGLYDGPHELGPLIFRSSEGEGTPIVSDLTPSYADELSFTLEHEVAADTSLRFSYVHKTLKNEFGTWNRAQVIPLLEAGIPCGDEVFPCPLDPFTGAPLNVARVPDEAAGQQDVIIDTYPDSDMHWDTLQFAASRRFRGNFFVQGSFDYQWRDELRSASGESRTLADPLGQTFFQNHSLEVANRQNNTNWQLRLLARYVFPLEVAVSTNFRHQNGWPWAAIHRVQIPGSGTRPIFLEDINNNRSDNVTLWDVRFEKAFNVSGRHRITGMVDIYNLLNSNAVTNMVLRTGGSFGDVIAALPPRTVTIGVRWQF